MARPESLVGRMKLLLDTGNGADVHFLVGQDDGQQELLPAHKAILIAASDVFEAMFRFEAGNAKAENVRRDPVLVPDVEVVAFRAMLSHIYTDDLTELDGHNLFVVLYAAKKYNIAGLVEACLQFPIPKLPDVFSALVQSRFFEENDYARRCLEYICQNADTSLHSDAFLEIDQSLLCEILDRDRLAIAEEIVLWKAALRWADAQCRRNGVDCSAENRRTMLGPALHQICFPRISQEEFSAQIVPSGVLTSGEVVSVLLYHAHPGRGVPALYPLPFPVDRFAYALSGRIVLEMVKLAELTTPRNGDVGPNSVGEHLRPFRDTVHLRGLPWTVSTILLIRQCLEQKRLDFFFHCDIESDGFGLTSAEGPVSTWSCTCRAIRRIVARKEGKADYVQEDTIGVISSSESREKFHHYMPFDVGE